MLKRGRTTAVQHHGDDIFMEGLPPLVGLRIVIVSEGLERAYDRGRGLEEMGYRVAACGDPGTARAFVAEMEPDAVVVDLAREVSFPADVCMRLRSTTEAPILIVGSTGTVPEMVRCFEAGADTYCKPQCPTEEIDLRLRALFRRVKKQVAEARPSEALPLRIGEIEIDALGQVVRNRGAVVPLSPTEFRLLMTLAEHRGQVVPSKALIARVWGTQYSSETHYLRLYVRYLRQKLEDDPSNPKYIVNRWGAGYALETPKQAA
jgi:two-component system, OmpR family, KDP operon response regulator KdpE